MVGGCALSGAIAVAAAATLSVSERYTGDNISEFHLLFILVTMENLTVFVLWRMYFNFC